ncbi:hypothetical protein [Streptomyces sp. SGAir0957]
MIDVPIPSRAGTRLCNACGDAFPLSAEFFHRDAMSAQGLKRRCRDCVNRAERERYAASADEILQRVRERRSERSAYFETQPQWQAA